ncbi:MAG: hypothetical protein KBD29_01335 [Candidatus Magasanikbacteria bacterium]|nr:hypothetical protein [Candidatus Magasanikbacteria bacterium]
MEEGTENTKESDIFEFLKSTGFILEMEVADHLKSQGYSVKVNELYFDYEENKNREIDLIATKKVNDIELTLIIECRQSHDKDWIFICSDKEPSIYYNFVKYSPELEYNQRPSESKIFDNTHIMGHKLPIAQNTVMKFKNQRKQANELTIRECLKKLPKAIIDYAHQNKNENKRIIYIPLVVFSNQFFSASYDGRLSINEHQIIRHSTIFDSQVYKYNHNYGEVSAIFFPSILSNSVKSSEGKDTNIPVSKTSRDLGTNYLIDFVTKKGLNDYLKIIEEGINTINLQHWKLKNEEKPSMIL